MNRISIGLLGRRGCQTWIFLLLSMVFTDLLAQSELEQFAAQLQFTGSNGQVLKFDFWRKSGAWEISNAEERIVLIASSPKGDSICLKFPLYDAELRFVRKGEALAGRWVNFAKTPTLSVPFNAVLVKNMSQKVDYSMAPLNGKFKWIFSPGKEEEVCLALFSSTPAYLRATILTETGDLRYLQGTQTDSSFYLACFDGTHAYRIEGQKKGGKWVGFFYSGSTGVDAFEMYPDATFELRDPNGIVQVKDTLKRADFSFRDTKGNLVSLSDKRFQNKVVLVQIMGSWCPNCMDETAYLAPFYEANKSKGLEIVALCFERTADTIKARTLVNKAITHYNAGYTFLITNLSGKDKAAAVFPMLSDIQSFPTLIYLDRQHRIRNVHSGFSGPATGLYYENFKKEHEDWVARLLAE